MFHRNPAIRPAGIKAKPVAVSKAPREVALSSTGDKSETKAF